MHASTIGCCATIHCYTTAQLHPCDRTRDKEPPALSIWSLAVAYSATAHGEGAVVHTDTAAATFRIGAAVGDQHVGEREGAPGSHVCATESANRAAPRDGPPDH
eukprot:scaffold3118_cov64-Phaeocystis_antarctica.AAC.6